MKKILEKAFLDILITLVIASSLIANALLIRWFLFFYTPMMLAARIIALTTKKVKSSRGVPEWVYHLLYAINVIVLVIQHWWILAVMWLAIWVLAFVFVQRRRAQSGYVKKRKR